MSQKGPPGVHRMLMHLEAVLLFTSPKTPKAVTCSLKHFRSIRGENMCDRRMKRLVHVLTTIVLVLSAVVHP